MSVDIIRVGMKKYLRWVYSFPIETDITYKEPYRYVIMVTYRIGSVRKRWGLSMNIAMNKGPLSVLTQHYGSGLKSTEEKVERFQKTQSQIDFFEGKKAELKNKHCETLDEIAQKLELFNNYNDQIDAVKKQFNYEQMMHCMDEAEEFGEKIAKAVEKLEPKTAEERREELAKEALGIEDDGGILDEMLEEIPEETLQDKIGEMLTDDEKLKEDLEEELQEILLTDNEEIKEIKENSEEELPEIVAQEKLTKMYLDKQYVPFDMKA